MIYRLHNKTKKSFNFTNDIILAAKWVAEMKTAQQHGELCCTKNREDWVIIKTW